MGPKIIQPHRVSAICIYVIEYFSSQNNPTDVALPLKMDKIF